MMRGQLAARRIAAVALVVVGGCSSGNGEVTFESTPPTGSAGTGTIDSGPTSPASTAVAGEEAVTSDDVVVTVDVAAPGAEISPLILGFSSSLPATDLNAAGIRLNSWGGNPATRFNYRIGHAWNHGADFEFRNTNYGTSGDDADTFLSVSGEAGIASRVAVPTLGWVAKDDLDSTCSFPDGAGGCLDRDEVGNCSGDGPRADPARANVPSDVAGVTEWIEGLLSAGHTIEYLAMDNEPELWGAQHFDVHPTCPTYEEILDKYVTYAQALREAAPDAKLTGPVTCCWFDYWRTAPGPADGTDAPFLDWFLTNVRVADEAFGQRTLDVLDVHYYPQSNVFNDDTDDETNARRIRSTRSLWEDGFRDESWITEPIRFIPRMKETIERSYPGTELMISEWNFGADATMNGAVVIADVLGVYGREGVDAASYWRNPQVGSPGYLAFKMHGNYDDEGSRFGGLVLPVTSTGESGVTAYAALDPTTDMVRVMLLNTRPTDPAEVALQVPGRRPSSASAFQLGGDDTSAITRRQVDLGAPLVLPPTSITLIELPAQ